MKTKASIENSDDGSALERGIQAALEASELSYPRVFETAYDGILLINARTAQIEDVVV